MHGHIKQFAEEFLKMDLQCVNLAVRVYCQLANFSLFRTDASFYTSKPSRRYQIQEGRIGAKVTVSSFVGFFAVWDPIQFESNPMQLLETERP
ncbi:hypothetical protein J1N35_040962 [Gossypium stocksii]|uniref:Uncharacterized protein n=1 Tax=Gossypium stocksii TaxID=47602 RepID=A0A9D3UF43_9ROSI|nr:hypothetical protein J1N35_040962 [Gossypium stocksii]